MAEAEHCLACDCSADSGDVVAGLLAAGGDVLLVQQSLFVCFLHHWLGTGEVRLELVAVVLGVLGLDRT